MKKIFIIITICCLSIRAFAGNSEQSAIDFIYTQQKNITNLLSIPEDTERFDKLYQEIDNTFAIDSIYKFVVARYSRMFEPTQKQVIIDFFKKMILLTYTIESQINVSNLSLEIKSATTEKLSNGTQRITLDADLIDTKNISLMKVSFVVLDDSQKQLIYDIKIENISMLISLRSMFSKKYQDSYYDSSLFISELEQEILSIDKEIYNTSEKIEEEVFIVQ